MGRQKSRDVSSTKISNHRVGLSGGDTWNQEMLHEKYLKDLEIKYNNQVSPGFKRRNNVKKRDKIPLQMNKKKPRDSLHDIRCKTRPNTARSDRKPAYFITNDIETEKINNTNPEKDEVEKFFDIIRDTVTDGIQKKLKELVGQHFQKISQRIDEMSGSLRKTECNLHSLCSDLNNRIHYYGEEHSRHFRYICMKLEYDKIFYQHINGLLRPQQEMTPHQLSAYSGCGQPLMNDLMNFPPVPPCPFQQCPCSTSRTGTGRTFNGQCDSANNNSNNNNSTTNGSTKNQENCSPRRKVKMNSAKVQKTPTTATTTAAAAAPSNQEFNLNIINSKEAANKDILNGLNEKPTAGSSELSLKDILATIKQCHQFENPESSTRKIGRRHKRGGDGRIQDDVSSDISSQMSTEDLSARQRELENLKIPHRSRQF